MSDEELVIVTAGDGVTNTTLAQHLLAVADHPEQVHWRPRMGGFEVPQHVASRYADKFGAPQEDAEPVKPAKGARKATRAKEKPADNPPPPAPVVAAVTEPAQEPAAPGGGEPIVAAVTEPVAGASTEPAAGDGDQNGGGGNA